MSLMDMLPWVFYKAALVLDIKSGPLHDHDHFLCIFIDTELSDFSIFSPMHAPKCW